VTLALDLPLSYRPRSRARLSSARRRALGELLGVGVLYALYSAARFLLPVRTGLALDHARSILRVEALAGLDIERSVNAWASAHLAVALLSSYWYAALHYTVTPTLLLMLRRRADGSTYRRLRNALVAATGLALVGYATFPAAPPRLLETGYTDTLAQMAPHGWWGGEASAPRGMGALTNQLAAMPSMHVGWAVWCALAIGALATTRRVRIAAWLYPLGTLFVVVATGNHYLLDGVAGAALVVVAARSLAAWSGRQGGYHPRQL
jgi:hypothetical protein